MQFVDNGMFALSLLESGEIAMIDEIGSDKDDDEVLGATSAEGMPLTRDDALIQPMREKTVEGLSLRLDTTGQEGEVGEV
jgi:hypothetical protein